jgi:arylesterase/paraoxonase
MDVVPSSSDPKRLFVYLINHRAPPNSQPAKIVGADSVVEIFEAQVGGSTLTHIKTVEDQTIITPNDVVGYGDGRSFYVTNDHGEKTGIVSSSLPASQPTL